MVLENPTKHLLGMNSFPFCGASSALISTLLLCLSLVVVIWICSICSWIEPMPREPRPRAEGGDGKQLWRAGKVGRQQETPPALPSGAVSLLCPLWGLENPAGMAGDGEGQENPRSPGWGRCCSVVLFTFCVPATGGPGKREGAYRDRE